MSLPILLSAIVKRGPILLQSPTGFDSAYSSFKVHFEETIFSRGPFKLSAVQHQSDQSMESPDQHTAPKEDNYPITSLNRKPHETVYFAIKKQDESSTHWILPSVSHDVPANTSPTDRLLSFLNQLTQKPAQLFAASNSPIAVGTKSPQPTFYYHFNIESPHILQPQPTWMFGWFSKAELSKNLESSTYNAIQDSLSS